jgi:Uma2 family endonuclease
VSPPNRAFPSPTPARPAIHGALSTLHISTTTATPAAIVFPVATVLSHHRVKHPRVEPSEYIALQADAGWSLPIEYIDGESVTMPPISDTASATQGALFLALGGWQGGTVDPGILRQDVFVAFPGGEHLAPDISWWRAGRRPPVVPGVVTVIPDLVVEVLSPSTRGNDLGPKRDVYMRSGVKELWLADPQARVLVRVRPNSGDLSLASGEVLSTDLLEGLSVDLAGVF